MTLTFRKLRIRKLRIMLVLSFLSLFLLPHGSGAAESADEYVIEATRLRSPDELSISTHEQSVEQISGNLDLTPALKRLPGVLVRDRSGPGSLVSVIPAQAASSGESQVSIDEFPIPNPLGSGLNFSLIPSPLIDRLDARDAFSSSIDFKLDPRPAAGGRINLKTLDWSEASSGNAAYSLRGGILFGLNNTVQGNAAILGKTDSGSYTVGATALTTDGAFRYRDSVSQEIKSREGNDSTGGGLLAKKSWNLKSGKFTFLGLASHLDHSIAGSLDDPRKEHEKDDFHVLGVRFDSTQFFGRLVGTHSRTGISGLQVGAATSDRIYTGFAQLGLRSVLNQHVSLESVLDNEFNWYGTYDGQFHRDQAGLTFQLPFTFGMRDEFVLIPVVRQEVASQYSGARDFRFTALHSISQQTEVSAGFAYDHAYPSLVANTGYNSSYGLVRSNPDLGVERHRIFNISATQKFQKLHLWASFSEDVATNRSTFTVYNDGTSQFVSSPQVQTWSFTTDAQWFPCSLLSFRLGNTIQRSLEKVSHRDMPYKPRYLGLASMMITPFEKLQLSLDTNYLSRRRYSSPADSFHGEDYLKPVLTTSVRVDYRWAPKHAAMMRVSNLFDVSGLDAPGYPMAGRAFWLGYSYGVR